MTTKKHTFGSPETGIVLCRTREPYRAIETLRQYAAAEKLNGFYVWSILRGWEKYNLSNPDDALTSDNMNEPMGAIRWVGTDQAPTPGLFVVFYPHALLKNQLAYMQQIKEYAKTFPVGRKRLVLVTPPGFAPTVELEDDLTILDFDTPSYKEINDAFARTFASLSEAKRPKLKDDEKDRLMSAATGLTASEAETALACAFVEHRMKLPNVTVDDLAKVIMDVKIEAVRKTDILEVMPAESMSNVGGLENLKEWVAKRSHCFTEEARAFGIEPPKGILLAGPPDCLGGTTVVRYRRGQRNSSRPITVARLFQQFNSADPSKPTNQANWGAGPTFLHSYDQLSGRVSYQQVEAVEYAGRARCKTLAFEGSGDLTLTEDHPVLVADGIFVPAGSLSKGDRIMAASSMRPAPALGRDLASRPKRKWETLKWYPNVKPKSVNGYLYYRTAHARLVVEANMNGMTVNEFIAVLKRGRDAEFLGLKFLEPGLEVHHIDEDPLNDDLGNLRVMTRAAHARLHGKFENFRVDYTTTTQVAHVRDAGEQDVFAIRMVAPNRNFAAAGVFVGDRAVEPTTIVPWDVTDIEQECGSISYKYIRQRLRAGGTSTAFYKIASYP